MNAVTIILAVVALDLTVITVVLSKLVFTRSGGRHHDDNFKEDKNDAELDRSSSGNNPASFHGTRRARADAHDGNLHVDHRHTGIPPYPESNPKA